MKITLDLPDGTTGAIVNCLVAHDAGNIHMVSITISSKDIRAGYKDCREYKVKENE